MISERQPRLVLVVSTLGPGGAERVAAELVNHWAGRGWEVTLLTLAGQIRDHYELDMRVHRVELDIVSVSRNLWQTLVANVRRQRMLRAAMRSIEPQLVISFIEQTNVRVIAALLGTGIPVAVCERVDPRAYVIGRAWNIARRLLYPFAQALVVQTFSVAEWAGSVVLPGKAHVIPNFVRELPEAPDAGIREALIVGMGRLERQKGFDLLLAAFAGSRARAAGWRLVILGEGPQRAVLEELAAHLGIAEQVAFPGVVAEPAAWLARARIFVLASRFEGFPNALLEAMAMGCTVVASDCPSGPSEIVRDRVDGRLVDVDSDSAIRAALDELVDEPAKCAELGLAAQIIRQRFAPSRVLAEWDGLIEPYLRVRQSVADE